MKTFITRCRAIILDEGELFLVQHPGRDFYALPGGKMDWGEGVIECLEREIVEELGIKPVVGRLQYVSTFSGRDIHTTEFFFEVLNAKDYRRVDAESPTHAFEIAEMHWVKPDTKIKILPKDMGQDFASGALLSDTVRFMKD